MFRINTLEEYRSEYKKSVDNPEAFWAEKAENFVWKKKWDKVLDWNFKTADTKWFINGKLNITENCLDRHLPKRADQIAYIWEPNGTNEDVVKLTYQQLHDEVCKFANVLKK